MISTLADSNMLASYCAKNVHKPAQITVSTIAGSGQDLEVDGISASASFSRPV
ncbi:hypothetical protein [Mucilaginibacter sp. 3215]|uniref:hypothetical protein n=1 Tax=Mucilaginibacter sp. 3215 TaxID=3373912 RepID=UPI003D1CC2F8